MNRCPLQPVGLHTLLDGECACGFSVDPTLDHLRALRKLMLPRPESDMRPIHEWLHGRE